MQDFIKKFDKSVCVFLLIAILILWKLLLPGYVLTLDMVFTPTLKIFTADYGDLFAMSPLLYFLKFLNYFFSGWVVQKIVLLILFFCLGYLPYKYLVLPDKYYIKYWSGLFYVVNPFVYERFLAGQWTILFAYSFLPPVIYFLIKFINQPEYKNSFSLLVWLTLITVFSLHFGVMVIMIFGFSFLYQIVAYWLGDREKFKKLIKNIFIFSLLFVVINSYWLYPYSKNINNSIISNFNQEHFESFKSSDDKKLGIYLNTLALYGFWGEGYSWGNYFVYPKNNLFFWTPLFLALIIVVFSGLILSIKKRSDNKMSLFFLIIGIFSFIFSLGVNDTIFKELNLWLLKNIWFWSGFRDTNKFSGWLVLSYAYFGGMGCYYIMGFFERRNIKDNSMIMSCLLTIPLLYTHAIWGGFSGQLQSVWYPQSWYQANSLLNNDQTNFKVLFLPWHFYFSLKFNNNLNTANPATSFFDKEIISSQNTEIGSIRQVKITEENRQIDDIILSDYYQKLTPKEIIDFFIKQEIKYIIFSRDLLEKDVFKYNFLNYHGLKIILDNQDLIVYKIY